VILRASSRRKPARNWGGEGGLPSETFAAKNGGFGIYLVFGIVIVTAAVNNGFRAKLEGTV